MSSDATLAPAERGNPSPGRGELLGASLRELARVRAADPAFRAAERAAATAWLEARGLPAPDDEAFRFTPLRSVLRVPFAAPGEGERATEPSADARLRGLDAHRITLVNGMPVSGVPGSAADAARAEGMALLASDPLRGVEIRRLGDVLRHEPGRVAAHLGLAGTSHGFDALNAGLFADGVVVFARGGVPAKLHIEHVARPSSAPTLSVPRVLVIAEAGSQLFLVETHAASGDLPHLESSVTEIDVAEGAHVTHARVHYGTSGAASLATIGVRQARDSRYTSRAFTFGGSLSRVDLRVKLDGPGAECVLDGLYVARSGELVDHHTTVDHVAPRCTSRQRYKGILEGTGTAVFDGTVFVRRGADRTAAHQENRNLLLSNDAVVHTKPHLEIDTDDVKCSHGATVGRLDPAQLFYLRARGMDASVARSLLTYAFAREMATEVEDDVLRAALEGAIADLLPDGGAARELA
jgi:Fe-S cluster assembly protein SufD